MRSRAGNAMPRQYSRTQESFWTKWVNGSAPFNCSGGHFRFAERIAALEPKWQAEVEDAYWRITRFMRSIGRDQEALETAEQYLLATTFAAEANTGKAEQISRALGTLSWSAHPCREHSTRRMGRPTRRRPRPQAGLGQIQLCPRIDAVGPKGEGKSNLFANRRAFA